MHRVAAFLFLLALAAPAGADDSNRRDAVPEVVVPVAPYEHQRLHYFGRQDHHVVPGTVTINRAPYRCDLDRKSFADRDGFVAHVRTAHQTPLEDIPGRIVVRDGVVHFVAR